MELAKKFMKIFDGLDTVHGKYILPPTTEPGKKAKGQGVTVQGGPTLALWDLHLKGKEGLGVTPINKQNNCVFGAVDVDVYDIDIVPLAKILARDKIPATVIRSKSGGPQLFVFTKEPVPALIMRTMLQKIAAFMGFGTAEIFPKQSEILAERNDAGNWINMPYFNHDKGTRYALDDEGRAMTAEEFIARIEKIAMSFEHISKFEIKLVDDFSDGPPCLQCMAHRGIPEGQRNSVMFSMGIYARKKSPDNWEVLLEEINQKNFLPPLASSEVQGVIKSHSKKDYHYPCKTQPLMTYCNASLCKTRKYGISGAGAAMNISSLTRLMTVPPIFFAEVESKDGPKRIELTTEELTNQQRFQRACVGQIKRAPHIVKQATWTEIINEALERCTDIPMPVDVTPQGQLLEYLERFCAGRAQARAEDEIFLGKPWTNEGTHSFRLIDLMAFLERQKFKELTRTQVVSIIRNIPGCENKEKWIKGKNARLWIVPEFARREEPFDTPQQPDANVF